MNIAEPNSKRKYNKEKINNVKAGDFWFYKIKVYTPFLFAAQTY